MKRRLLGGAFLVVTGVAGFLWYENFRDCPHVWRRLVRAALFMKYTPASDIRFRRNRISGYGPGPRGSTVDSSGVEASDCVVVGWGVFRFPTPADAEAQFQDWVHSASKVIEITENDPTGVQRAVLRVGDKSDFRYPFNIIFKKKHSTQIHSIWSDSLEHAVRFEKQTKWNID